MRKVVRKELKKLKRGLISLGNCHNGLCDSLDDTEELLIQMISEERKLRLLLEQRVALLEEELI